LSRYKCRIKLTAIVLTAIFIALCMSPAAHAAQVAGIVSGGEYNIRSRASGKYLNVNAGRDANGTNVMQWTKDNSVEQRFMPEYLPSADAYLLRAVCSANGGSRVLDVYRSSGQLKSGCNADIWSQNDTAAQQWNIIRLNNGFYKIVLRSNQKLALTSYGTGNGTGSGKQPDSTGNVFVSTYTGAANQQWAFEQQTTAKNKYAALGWSYFFRGGNARYVGGYYYYNSPAGHMGIDVLAPAGVPVYSVTSGKVRSSYTAVNGGNNIYITPNVSPAGEQLDIGQYHFSRRNVSAGAAVTPNTIIGYVGNTGNSNAPHLHFEVSKTGRYTTNVKDHIDPQLFFPNIRFTHTGKTP